MSAQWKRHPSRWGRGARNSYLIGDRSHGEGKVGADGLVHLDGYVDAGKFLEPGTLDRNGISADADVRQRVFAGASRNSVVADSRGCLQGTHLSVRDSGTLAIRDSADQGRLKLALTTAGVIQSGDITVGDPPGESFAGPGQRGEQNDVSLDGVTMLNTIHRTVDFPPAPDAIQEVSVQTGTYSAQYGTYLGVHINAVSKAGTNQLHGVCRCKIHVRSPFRSTSGSPL